MPSKKTVKRSKQKTKFVYFFGNKKAEGNAGMKDLLGGKGANLAEMTNLGLPVPPGFTISAEVCQLFFQSKKQWPKGLEKQIKVNLNKIEKATGKNFGDQSNPLLLSVRSGAAVSMPGMMDTVLNIGLNEKSLAGLAKETENPRFAWDSYRRFIQMFGDVVMGVPHFAFEEQLKKVKSRYQKKEDIELNTDELKEVVRNYKKIYRKFTKEKFPDDPQEQLYKAINAVFESWNTPRAVKYREINEIKGLVGTGVNVQTMVFGNMGNDSGTGVCFTRDPATGEDKLHGEFLINAQGEDVVAGIRTPVNIDQLKNIMPKSYRELLDIRKKLEDNYKDMQDLEFTIEKKTMYILQTRTGKRTGPAAVKIAVDMVKQRLIGKNEALNRITASDIDQLLHPRFQEKTIKQSNSLTQGLPASPGAAVGQIVFKAEDAEKWAEDGKSVILCRIETSPEDVAGMHKAVGILTSVGGMTSHAAVVARGWGKCCVVGAGDVKINYDKKTMEINGKMFSEGDVISIDGGTGNIYEGEIPTESSLISSDFKTVMKWADQIRKIKVRTNADSPGDTEKAVQMGAEGIGLCRTEHMFFAEDRLSTFRRLILFAYKAKQIQGMISKAVKNVNKIEYQKEYVKVYDQYTKALKDLLPLQRKDFEGIFKVLKGKPATIRLLDPPLHEFLPKSEKDQKSLAKETGFTYEQIKQIVEDLHEQNPMLGHRGCRLGLTYPEISDTQIKAIMEAAINVKKKNRIKVLPEIMIPLVGNWRELKIARERAEQVIEEVFKNKKVKKGYINYQIGTMIEIPRAAVTADQISDYADFFSFGTNDLTQMGAGFSRDDAGKFLDEYLKLGIYGQDPFQSLDQEGIGKLVQMGIELGRSKKKNLKIGICGEHGGDPESVEFCYKVGMNYVSCSPLRVPIARLAAAKAVLKSSSKKKQQKVTKKSLKSPGKTKKTKKK
ncbi:MAG: pyruvate, phosphate dikinase [bacterium]